MRAVIVVLAIVLAGCSQIPGPGRGDDGAAPGGFSLEGHPEFCTSQETCKFWDDQYHQYVVYDLDTTVFDVVIVPPAGISTPDNIAASRQAVQAWNDGILELGQPWLQDGFAMNIHAVGIDVPSLADVEDPEIIVASTSAAFLVGIGLEPKQLTCMIIGEETVQHHGGHLHGDNWIGASDCTNTGFTCLALNVGAMDPRGLYDLIAHEVGHCLGAGHVGDAGDFRARYAPVADIMSYQDDPEQVHCVSNMNVRVLEGVYAHLLGQPEDVWLPRGSYHEFPPSEYAQVDCDNPDTAST